MGELGTKGMATLVPGLGVGVGEATYALTELKANAANKKS